MNKKDLLKCKQNGYHQWNWNMANQLGTFDEAHIQLECKICGAVAELYGDVRAEDGRHICWLIDEE
tara:strand:+ start:356 stop:553 length:198 start_codon:yes stop_codon:yes gene_type:complete